MASRSGRAAAALVAGAAALLLGAALLASATLPPGATPALAQEVDPEQQLAIERQLLCPQCVNERLDQCARAICEDMRATIREQLAAGTPPDQIVFFFRARYGDRVLAQLPREGFNLLLFGWVAGSLALVAAGGGFALLRMRRSARRSARAGEP
ncbi:MAG: hypothetical protein F4150_02595 [Chloroflexi bacterium]|nr:hypothetical protein [Chloroflexota bacterium]